MKTDPEAKIMIVVAIIVVSLAVTTFSMCGAKNTSTLIADQRIIQPTEVDTNERAFDLKIRGPELQKAVRWGYSTPLDGEQKWLNGFTLRHFVAQNIFLGETIVYKKESPGNSVYVEGSDEVSVWVDGVRVDIRPGSFKVISHPVTELVFVALYERGYLKVGEIETKEETNERK